LKVALYARYSSENQREASIADQLGICREYAARQHWVVSREFTDHAVSGATLLRSGFQALMREALDGMLISSLQNLWIGSVATTLNHTIHHLMILDAIVENPDLVWLGTAGEKAARLTALTRIAPSDLPHVAVGKGNALTVRYFPERLPIGIHLAGRGVVVYVITAPWLDEFRVFLRAARRAASRAARVRIRGRMLRSLRSFDCSLAKRRARSSLEP
jgi:hypothetical protein